MSDVDWVKAAATDDAVVVELLLRLRHAMPSTREPPPPPAPPLEWSVRQRRSKPIPLANKKPTPRSSPTTPLSWSGATSVSGGGGDGVEESSRPPPRLPEATRSKVAATSETTTSKRSRKKKTLAELKEEEVLLLKERRHLKRDLATLRITLEKQRATNESLKRLKLDVESQSSVEKVAVAAFVEAIPNQMQQKIVSCDPIPSTLPPDVRIDDHHHAMQPPSTPNGTSKLQQEVINQGNEFVIPDLNQPLEEDDFKSEVLHRVS